MGATIRSYEHRERHLMNELEKMRRERDGLHQRVCQLESCSEKRSCPEVTHQQRLVQRVSHLERENMEYSVDQKTAEEQTSELLALAQDALEDNRHKIQSSPYPRVRKSSRPVDPKCGYV